MLTAIDTRPECQAPVERPERHYPAHLAAAWWAQPTAEGRRLALEAKLEREPPQPTYSHGRR
ncbi:hypothetical protein FNT36_18545 [Hymenobacter setariae]|uniref:Uncharacterized protein n=1 Tax=Hymenobacter setariae TaxID=2594794 RepID=A0A558BT18_9BACT|nr:hypothetical protein FNT36_18545 [Hymenobacter setariae]